MSCLSVIDVTNGTCCNQQKLEKARKLRELRQASDGLRTDVDVRLVTGESSSVVPDLASAPCLLHGVDAPLVAESAARGAHESARE